MTGTELLREARKLHPDAKRVLLTAYADTEAAIAAINDVGARPLPDEAVGSARSSSCIRCSTICSPSGRARASAVRGHPRHRIALVAAELRHARFPLAQPGARISGSTSSSTRRCASCVKSIAGDPRGCRSCCSRTARTLVAPSHARAGGEGRPADAAPKRPFYDVAIVGGGPAGLANAVYGASEGLQRGARSSRTRRAGRPARAR